MVGDATINGSETGTSFKQALYFKEIGFNLHDTMIYKKTGFQYPSNNRYHQEFEYMFIFSKEFPKTFNPIRKKNKWVENRKHWTVRTKKGDLKIMKGKKEVGEFGMLGNVWLISNGFLKTTKDLYAYEHPAMFPEKLAEDHIRSWSNKGDLVLDPMCGSGTTCKASQFLGRNFIGIDVSKKYVKIARQRLRQKPML